MSLVPRPLSLTVNGQTVGPMDVPEGMPMIDFLHEYPFLEWPDCFSGTLSRGVEPLFFCDKKPARKLPQPRGGKRSETNGEKPRRH